MDFSSLFPSTDNLFKFLFLGGLIMVFTAMIYPLQKKQEREIEVLNHNQQVELINKEIRVLREDIKTLQIKTKQAIISCKALIKERKSLNTERKTLITNQIIAIQKGINDSAEILKHKQDSINTKVIVLHFNENKIELLRRYVQTYDRYSFWLLLCGIPLSIVGLVFWTISTVKTERLKTKELNRA